MLESLFNYTAFMNRQLFQFFEHQPGTYLPQIEKLMCHIVNAHSIWLSRIHKETCTAKVWEIRPIAANIALDLENQKRTQDLLLCNTLKATVPYNNTKGLQFSNTIEDILFHIINHSTHHRAQICSLISQNGATPPVTDYIFYKRNTL